LVLSASKFTTLAFSSESDNLGQLLKFMRLMNLHYPLTITFLFFAVSFSFAQNYGKYWVFFKDKSPEGFNPYEYFDKNALERRAKHGLPLFDYTDLPVNEAYVQKINELADSIGVVSRWLNGLAFFGSDVDLAKIKALPFVEDAWMAQQAVVCLSSIDSEKDGLIKELTEEHKKLLSHQLASLGAEHFEKANLNGKGVRIAVFDAGFPGVDSHPAFAHIRKENRIIKTWDFIRKKENVYGANSHGTMVLSCIAGIADGKNIGLATGAEFLLARTERAFAEPFSEEENWLAAAEWADKNGVHIINSSLGYTYHRYFTEQMDGRHSLVARAANMAASKGILVVNAAGNDGGNKWKIIGTPADADSVLAVGGIDPETYMHVYFSSFGPTAQKVLKPNVSSYGVVIAANAKTLTKTQGTSFSSPLVAGFAACAMQAKPGLKVMELFREIEKSGDLYPYYDYAHGYGMPRAEYFNGDLQNPSPTFDLVVDSVIIKVKIKEDFAPPIKTLEKVAELHQAQNPARPYESQRQHYLYYHIENPEGSLDRYFVLLVEKTVPLEIPVSDFKAGQTLRVHYKGYTQSHTF
jgi:serine protease AprX